MQAIVALTLASSLVLGPAVAPAETDEPATASEGQADEGTDAPAEVEGPSDEAPASEASTDAPSEDDAPNGEAAATTDAPAEAQTPSEDPAASDEPASEQAAPPSGDPAAVSTSSTEIMLPAKRDRLGCDGSRPCRRMTIAGIIVGTLGLAAVGVGIGLLVKPDEVVPEQPIFVTSTHPPGLVTVTIGAGVALTSVLMLVAAHRGYKHLDDEQARVRLTAGGLRF